MPRITGLLVAAIVTLSSGAVSAQVYVGSTGHTGDSAQMTRADQENGSAYNHMVGTGVKTAVVKERPNAKTEAPAQAQPPAAKPATLADIHPGSALRDRDGANVGTIDSVGADGVVVNTGETKIKVPLMAFGTDNKGPLLGITAAKFHELIAKAHGSN